MNLTPLHSNRAAVPPIVEEALAGSAGPLLDGLRADMEERFGHDFSHLRLHTRVCGGIRGEPNPLRGLA